MKILLLITSILVLLTSFSQKKLEKIIMNDDISKLEKYISKKNGEIDQLIERTSDEGEIESFSPLLVTSFEKADSIEQYLISHIDLFENKKHVISEAFIHSLSEEENPVSNQLYKLGVDPNDSCGACKYNTAIMIAASYGNEDWFFKLKDESDVTHSNPSGENLAHMAAAGSSSRIARWVFANKDIDLNKKSKTGDTPLDFAVYNQENPKVVSYLLKEGAKIAEANNLLEAWPFNPSEEIFYDNLVFNRKSDVWKVDDEGNLPIIWALVQEEEGDYKIQQFDLFKRILDMMTAPGEAENLMAFENENLYFFDSMNDFLMLCELRGDFAFSIHVFKDFVKLCAIAEHNSELRVLTKKNFKKACQLFGKEEVVEIYNNNELWIP
ncbi:MAG: ankyrin repeat protein [Arenicella sp.]|jgi:ankyrin repeat protein